MTDAPHPPTSTELADLWRPEDEPRQLRHHRTECRCRPDLLLDPDAVHDAVILDQEGGNA
jgi:hypothetical protein